MQELTITRVQECANSRFDLRRLSKSKESVDLCPNTLRAYHALGLPFYRMGKTVFFSVSELEGFIKSRGATRPAAEAAKQ
jgi:hypothetical protein